MEKMRNGEKEGSEGAVAGWLLQAYLFNLHRAENSKPQKIFIFILCPKSTIRIITGANVKSLEGTMS